MSQFPPYIVQNAWISVKDHLPSGQTLDDSPSVLITDGDYIGIGWYEAEYFSDNPKDDLKNSSAVWHSDNSILEGKSVSGWPVITHWMPLPELPE